MVITGQDSVTGDAGWSEIKKRLLQVTLSLSVAIVPLIGSIFIANLVDITRYGGLLGFAICCFYPAALQLKSQYDCNKAFCEAVELSQQDKHKLPSVKYESDSSLENENTPLIAEFPAVKYFHWNNPCYTTPYQTIFSHPYMVVLSLLFSFVAFGLTIASLPIRVHQND